MNKQHQKSWDAAKPVLKGKSQLEMFETYI